MAGSVPLVSIGLPVYNGERYLEAAVDSLLAQTFTDFELIISDNASTDRTEAIGRAYAARDPRVRYFRNEHNIGAGPNYNRVFALAAGRYFKWAAHDDVCAPDFLARCVAALDADPAVVLAYPRTTHIDEQGQVTGTYAVAFATDSDRPAVRFHDLILINHWCFQIFGVIRADVLRRTPLIGSFAASDRTLLARLGLLGRFHEVPEHLFLRRRHPEQLTALPSRRLHARWYDPRQRRQITFPQWRILGEYLKAVRAVPLAGAERLACGRHLLAWIRRYRGKLGDDLVWAARQALALPARGRRHEDGLPKSV